MILKVFPEKITNQPFDQFLYNEVKPYASEYTDEKGFEESAVKIDHGAKMMKVYVGIKEKAEQYVLDISAGIEDGQRIRAELLWVMTSMNNLSMMTPDETVQVLAVIGASRAVKNGVFAVVGIILMALW